MIKCCVILAAGGGKKLWPYATIRNKAMVPVGAKPLILHTAEALRDAGVERVLVAAGAFASQLRHALRNFPGAEVVELGETGGSADTLSRLSDKLSGPFGLLYGDTLYDPRLLREFFAKAEAPCALAAKIPEAKCPDCLCLKADERGQVVCVAGHPRDGYTLRFAGFALDERIFPYLSGNPGYFNRVDVGIMSPKESFLEASFANLAEDIPARAYPCAEDQAIDIDRPWDILVANFSAADRLAGALTQNELGEGASIDPTAAIDGFVRLGKNSRIGRNVRIRGNLIVGDDTVIDNGAFLWGHNIIGSGTRIENYCYVDWRAVIGSGCAVNHCAELSGVIFDGVYLYHYMELFGVLGEHTDIGAATVCGTLRFDEGLTAANVNGRREYPKDYSGASFLGDFCRTGVNAILSPGRRIGCYSIIGAGTILMKDLPDRTLIYPKQEQEERPWGPEKYGW